MNVREIEESELLGDAAGWDSFLAASRADSFFLRHAWLTTFWKHFGADKKLFVLEVTDGGRRIGLAPLCITRQTHHRVLSLRELGFLGREKVTGDYLDLIAEPGREAEVLGAVVDHALRRVDAWDLLRISDVPESSPTPGAFDALARERGLEPMPAQGQTCPYLPLAGSWDAFLASCSSNLRSNLRRREKKLLAMGATFVDRSTHDLPGALDALFALHGARWSTRGRTGNFVDPRVLAFHRELAPALAAEGTLGLWTVEAGSKAVAAIYGFRHRGRFLYYQAGFDPAYAEHGVGLALMGHAIRESIAAGIGEFDYLRGEEDYKRRWTDLARKTVSTMVLRPSIKAFAWRTLDSSKQVAKRVLRRA